MINIKSSSYTFYEELKNSAPEGVNVELQPIRMSYKDHAPSPDEVAVALNININITIDLAKIGALAVSAWIAKKYINIRSRESKLKAVINEKQIPLEQKQSQEVIESEVINESKK